MRHRDGPSGSLRPETYGGTRQLGGNGLGPSAAAATNLVGGDVSKKARAGEDIPAPSLAICVVPRRPFARSALKYLFTRATISFFAQDRRKFLFPRPTKSFFQRRYRNREHLRYVAQQACLVWFGIEIAFSREGRRDSDNPHQCGTRHLTTQHRRYRQHRQQQLGRDPATSVRKVLMWREPCSSKVQTMLTMLTRASARVGGVG